MTDPGLCRRQERRCLAVGRVPGPESRPGQCAELDREAVSSERRALSCR